MQLYFELCKLPKLYDVYLHCRCRGPVTCQLSYLVDRWGWSFSQDWILSIMLFTRQYGTHSTTIVARIVCLLSSVRWKLTTNMPNADRRYLNCRCCAFGMCAVGQQWQQH